MESKGTDDNAQDALNFVHVQRHNFALRRPFVIICI